MRVVHRLQRMHVNKRVLVRDSSLLALYSPYVVSGRQGVRHHILIPLSNVPRTSSLVLVSQRTELLCFSNRLDAHLLCAIVFYCVRSTCPRLSPLLAPLVVFVNAPVALGSCTIIARARHRECT